jgi:hypothetical protein
VGLRALSITVASIDIATAGPDEVASLVLSAGAVPSTTVAPTPATLNTGMRALCEESR